MAIIKTIEDFIWAYNAKFVDFDKNKNFWCVDIPRQYMADVLKISGWTLAPVAYAKDLYYRFNPTTPFVRIPYTTGFIPQKGDIIIWKAWVPLLTFIAGHVGVVTYADKAGVIVIEQNMPTGSPCRLHRYTYRGILGVLRYTPNK